MRDQIKISAIVILYNPVALLLDELCASLSGQVDHIFLIDNSSGDNAAEYTQYTQSPCCTYHPLLDNKGIATAQNTGIDLAVQQGFSHVLLMDQDSQPALNMVEELLRAEEALQQQRVAAVGPMFTDKKTGEIGGKKVLDKAGNADIVAVDHVIASGALIRLNALQAIGKMRDELFIDWVDFEWGLRAKALGYQSYIAKNAIMHHSVGDSFMRILGRNINLHSAFRNYFIIRNAIYLITTTGINFKGKCILLKKVIVYIFLFPFLLRRKRCTLFLLIRAVHDGFRRKMYRGYFE